MLRVVRHENPRSFLARAESWLLEREAENNLVLGIVTRLLDEPDAWGTPVYLATVEDPAVVGCVYRTGEYKPVLTRLPTEALPFLVEDLSEIFPSLPAVMGPEPQVQNFAEQWSSRTGQAFRPGMRQRVYSLESVRALETPVPGRFRPATMEDASLLSEWFRSFEQETHVGLSGGADGARKWLDRKALFVWEDGNVVSMAGTGGRTPNGARVGAVYTPAELRGRGYASACVAALSQHLLDDGLTYCALYTDLSNPTSNSIYRRIGYEPVADVSDYEFLPAAD